MSKGTEINKLRLEADAISKRLTGSDYEYIQMLDEWYLIIKKLEALESDMVTLEINKLPLLEGFLDDRCSVTVPKEVSEAASNNMR